MKSLNIKQFFKVLSIFLFFVIFIGTSIVYAATSTEISFCDYGGVRRAFKIVGILLNFIKVIVPLIIVFTSMSSFFGLILSGKVDDLKAKLMQVTKNVIAGLIIFFLPTVINYAIETLVGHEEEAGFTACTTCMLDTDHCVIPDKDPETYDPE